MMELIRQIPGLFASYISNNHMMVLVVAGILYLLLQEGEISRRAKIFLVSAAFLLFLVWVPVSAAFLMKYRTSLQEYGTLANLVPFPGIIALAGICCLQNEFRGREKKNTILWFGGIGISLMLFFLLGNQGMLQKVSMEEVLQRREQNRVVSYLLDETGAGEKLRYSKLWAPKDILTLTKQRDGGVMLLYGRDLWEGKVAALSYEEYPPEYASYYDFMEELWEEYGTFASNTEGQEEELLARGEEDGEILRGILEQGATVWVIPKQAENRISYATQLIGEKYGWKAEQLEQLNGYVVYYLWK